MSVLSSHLGLSRLESRIVGRETSFFAEDLEAHAEILRETIRGSRILVIGGAGSIGSETIRIIVRFAPRSVHVIDHHENGLAELVRNLRAAAEAVQVPDLLTLPFDYASDTFRLWFASQPDYDHVLNFAALKHVRSEKDPYSILAMLDNNVLKLVRLARLLADRKGLARLFCVSTDKAANPSSMMGATKRLMEHAMFSSDIAWPDGLAISSARFANVAFSNGSLLQSWQQRLAARQPMACPEGCRRFFVALPESGHLCTLAGLAGDHGNIHVPTLDPAHHLQLLQDVAAWFLETNGYEAHFTRDEDEALGSVERLAAAGKWPVLLTPLDTAGEKPYEEFVGENETELPTRFKALNRVPYLPPAESGSFPAMLDWLRNEMAAPGGTPLSLAELKERIARVEPSFARTHVASGKSLDQRI